MKRYALTDLVWTTTTLAEAGGVTTGRIRQLCLSGRLDALKVGGRWLIFDESARSWLSSYRKRGRKPKDLRELEGEQLALDLDK